MTSATFNHFPVTALSVKPGPRSIARDWRKDDREDSADPKRKENAMTAMRNLHKAINDLKEMVDKAHEGRPWSQKPGQASVGNFIHESRKRDREGESNRKDVAAGALKEMTKGDPHGNQRWDKQVEPKEDFDRREAHIANRNVRRENIRAEIRADPEFGKALPKNLKKIADSVRAPKGSEEREDEDSYLKEHMGDKFDKASAMMNVLGHQKKQPGTKPVAGGEKAFMPTKVKKSEPVTQEDMMNLSKSLMDLRDVVKATVQVLGRGIPKKGKFDSMGRNYKPPKQEKKE